MCHQVKFFVEILKKFSVQNTRKISLIRLIEIFFKFSFKKGKHCKKYEDVNIVLFFVKNEKYDNRYASIY